MTVPKTGRIAFVSITVLCSLLALNHIFSMSEDPSKTKSSNRIELSTTTAVGKTVVEKNSTHNRNFTIEGEGLSVDDLGIDSLLIRVGIRPRAYPRWNPRLSLPCFGGGVASKSGRGFLFIKPPKSGSTTGASVTLRIAANVAKLVKLESRHPRRKPVCACWVDHSPASLLPFVANRTREESFLWSVLRNPTDRTVSEFFHFKVSRERWPSNDASFRKFLQNNNNFTNYYLRYLMLGDRPPVDTINPGNFSGGVGDDPAAVINSILDSYDFLAVTERFEESAVALGMLLGLAMTDVLYLSSKTSGSYDDGRFRSGRCTLIAKSFVSPVMQQYFANPGYRSSVYWDELLHAAVNRSLDLTIDETLGRDDFDRELQRFRTMRSAINEICTSKKVKFPCADDGVKRRQTNCLRFDMGCGHSCMDSVVARNKCPMNLNVLSSMTGCW